MNPYHFPPKSETVSLNGRPRPYRAHTPHDPPPRAQFPQYRQLVHAVHNAEPVHVPHVLGGGVLAFAWTGFPANTGLQRAIKAMALSRVFMNPG